MKLERISDLEFPNTPVDIAKNKEVREAVVKASAYVTIALEESDISHSRSEEGAAVTDATHNLKENKTADEYIDLAIQELSYAESEVNNSGYQSELADIRETLQSL
jgi:hypothetical protein